MKDANTQGIGKMDDKTRCAKCRSIIRDDEWIYLIPTEECRYHELACVCKSCRDEYCGLAGVCSHNSYMDQSIRDMMNSSGVNPEIFGEETKNEKDKNL